MCTLVSYKLKLNCNFDTVTTNHGYPTQCLLMEQKYSGPPVQSGLTESVRQPASQLNKYQAVGIGMQNFYVIYQLYCASVW